MSRKQQRERTRQEQRAAELSSAQLVDFLQRYVNSLGEAVRIYAQNATPVALDVVDENLVSLAVITAELQTRRGDTYVPAPDPHLQDLVSKFMRLQGDPSAGQAL